MRVGINISGRQLLRRDLVHLVEQSLADSGLPAACLSLELTESSLLHDRDLAAETLLALRQRDINVWLDDFGTGFSGLNHLRQLRVSGVKIDRSFVADILSDPDDLALSSAIIAMAHSVGMRVIAEGVESREQLKLLRDNGCDLVQGFLLARPMPAAEIAAFRPEPGLFSPASD
jgi:EAL domain-containing protein (putative c-di-GMP-specific phosphodiesterase class I)